MSMQSFGFFLCFLGTGSIGPRCCSSLLKWAFEILFFSDLLLLMLPLFLSWSQSLVSHGCEPKDWRSLELWALAYCHICVHSIAQVLLRWPILVPRATLFCCISIHSINQFLLSWLDVLHGLSWFFMPCCGDVFLLIYSSNSLSLVILRVLVFPNCCFPWRLVPSLVDQHPWSISPVQIDVTFIQINKLLVDII